MKFGNADGRNDRLDSFMAMGGAYNIAIIKRMACNLIDTGYLKLPVIYFDDMVAEGCGATNWSGWRRSPLGSL